MPAKVQGQSYITLEKFKNALLASGFINIPDNPSEGDAGPFQTLFEEYRPIFVTALETDLNLISAKIDSVKDTLFVPEDSDAQGSTLCYFYTILHIDEKNVPVAFKYLVFQNAIKCYLHGNVFQSQIKELSTSRNTALRGIAMSYSNPDGVNLYDLIQQTTKRLTQWIPFLK